MSERQTLEEHLSELDRAREVARSRLDPHWDWLEITSVGSAKPEFLKGMCRHLEVVPVTSGGETVAHLCLTCDGQLPAEWQP